MDGAVLKRGISTLTQPKDVSTSRLLVLVNLVETVLTYIQGRTVPIGPKGSASVETVAGLNMTQQEKERTPNLQEVRLQEGAKNAEDLPCHLRVHLHLS